MLSIFDDIRFGARGPFTEDAIASIVFDSRRIEKDCLFVAIRGTQADGHDFLQEAVQKRAIAVVVEDPSRVPSEFDGAVITVKDSRLALNQLAARFHGLPAQKLFCVGVTGTNGKTTVTHMIEAILNAHGLPAGVIGTINHHFGERVWSTELTTPDPLSFQKRLREFLEAGAKSVALEVSSIGLVQSRVDEVPFDVAVFTNLSRDHLDYHKNMEDYFQAKQKLFSELLKNSSKADPVAIINGDDAYGIRLLGEVGSRRIWSYGEKADATLRFTVLEQGFFGTRFNLRTLQGEKEFLIRMTGLHNVYNAVAAVGAGLAAGASLDLCAQALSGLHGVKGRLESVPNEKGIHVFVDYAHTDGAIETVLKYLRGIREAARLDCRIITVFGCGGDRDRGKRPLMMKAAASGSDLVVVTSDNPRTEDPDRIIQDALGGVASEALEQTVFAVTDRREGIRKALTELAQAGDVVLIAGKGHEDYQQIGKEKFPFSDVEVAREILK